MTEEDLHIIESYLQDRLGAAEKQAFEDRLRQDQDLRYATGQMKQSIIAIRQSVLDQKMELLKGEENSLSMQRTPPALIRPMYKWIAAAAAVILFGVFLIRPLLKEDDTIQNQYLAEHFDDYVIHETTRGNNPDPKITPEQERAYNLYRMQKFHKAIPLLETLWEEKRDTMALFYLTVSKVAIGEKGEFSQKIFIRKEYVKLISELK